MNPDDDFNLDHALDWDDFKDWRKGRKVKSRSCKDKGRRLVVELRNAILEAFPHLHPDDIQLVPTSVGGADLKLSPAARKCWPFATECKNQEALSIWAAMKQAEENADGYDPAVVYRRNRTEPWVSVPLPVLLSLLIDVRLWYKLQRKQS